MRTVTLAFAVICCAAPSIAAAPQVGAVADRAGQTAPQVPLRDAAAPRDGACAITGRVTTAADGSPLARATVVLGGRTLGAGQRLAETDEQGRYEFRGLAPGSYHVWVRRRGYVQPQSTGMLTIELEGERATARADVALERAGVITGRVLDEVGEPMPYVAVQALRHTRAGPEATPQGRDTDDEGRFRLFDIEPGEYLVRADPGSGRGGALAAGSDGKLAYMAAFAPGVPDPGSAQVVVIGRTREIGGIDIRLSRQRTYRVTGSVLESSGRPPRSAYLMVMSRDPVGGGMSGTGTEIKPDGRFAIDGLAPGEYILEVAYMPFEFEAERATEYGRHELAVQEDVEDLTIVTRPTATVVGEVVFEGAPPGLAVPDELRVGALRLDHLQHRGSGAPRMARVGEDFRFTLRGLAGPSILQPVSETPKGWWFDRVLYRGQDVTDVPTEFASSGAGSPDVLLVFTNRAATVTGHVTRPDGKPAARARVFAFAESRPPGVEQHSADRFTVADAQGRFELPGLTADRYLVAAEDSAGPWQGVYERLAPSATAVGLLKGDRKVVDLRLTAPDL